VLVGREEAVWFHATDEIGAQLELGIQDRDEICSVSWYPIHSVNSMYASHYDWLKLLRTELREMERGFVSHSLAAGVPAEPFVSHTQKEIEVPPSVSSAVSVGKKRKN
jgi:hypothetical protein